MDYAVFTNNYQENQKLLDNGLGISRSFDIVGKDMCIGGRQARLFFVDGFAKDEVMEKVMEFLLSLTSEQLIAASNAEEFSRRYISYLEAAPESQLDTVITAILSGTLALLVEGYTQAILIDARTYPARGIEEPDDDRVLRGAHEGFVETLVQNTALIRRRIRNPDLTMEILQIGQKSKTDIVLCYMNNIADPDTIKRLKKKLSSIHIGSLTMGQESLAECLLPPSWWNPFPRIRYTERPDAATAGVIEGSILIIVDNSPSVMVLPSSLWDFVQDANDFYFPPLVGSYLRIVRMGVFLITLLLTPIWYLLISHPEILPPWLEFIQIVEMNSVPVLAQLLILELVIDALKLASLNTPSSLSNSFSVVGALILGDFAVKARWFVPEVVLYMAFVAIANFTQPSFELGYAFKLFRVLLLILIALWGPFGLIAGLILMIIAAASTPTVTGRNYLYPLIPFRGRALLRLLVRMPLHRSNS